MEHEYVAEWFRFADSDLASAEYLKGMKPQPLEIICYHCQQAAEKYLKSYLIFMGIDEVPKTHNTVYLNEECTKLDKRFTKINDEALKLNKYGSQPRYPFEVYIQERDMLNAVEYARTVKDFEPLVEIRKIILSDGPGGSAE